MIARTAALALACAAVRTFHSSKGDVMGKADRERAEHQAKLATSGYRVPDSFYVDTKEHAESAEKKSGDGGRSAADIADDDSEHGYKGALQSKEDFADAVRKRANGPPDSAPANKSATPGTENSDSVAFASSAAEEAAKEAGLLPADFANAKPSGEKGFTKSDVDQIAAEKSK
jgi:hypothetical protein